MTATNIDKNLKERIYCNVEVFEKAEYFIPTKKFLTGSINLLEDFITLMALLKKFENDISNKVSKENYKKSINEVLVLFINEDFEDKEICKELLFCKSNNR